MIKKIKKIVKLVDMDRLEYSLEFALKILMLAKMILNQQLLKEMLLDNVCKVKKLLIFKLIFIKI